jgi:hypothetical protein
LPAISPSYLYTFIALLAVSSLLVFSFTAYANTMRSSSELGQLKNLVGYIAARGTELLTLAMAANATTESFVQMPSSVGDELYWLQLHNDSENAWVEGGFGSVPLGGSILRVYLPGEVAAIGYFIGGRGAARLNCESGVGIMQLRLANVDVGD